ncbi:MAG: energy transducer TonB [Desulfovibrio sp.]|jgi:protein TonB|nr:energy transducer TonB [Desulfovibrio sp.]
MRNDIRRLTASGAAALAVHLILLFGAGRWDLAAGSPQTRPERTELYLMYQAEARQESVSPPEASPETPRETPPESPPEPPPVPVEETPDLAPVEEAPAPVERAPDPVPVERARPARVAEARRSSSARPKPAAETSTSRQDGTTGRQGEVSNPQPLAEFVNSKPVYPELARKRGQEGRVILDVDVDERGYAVRVTVRRGSGFSLLDEAALKSVGKWRFRPARADGRSVAGHVTVPVEFRLK